MEFISLHWCIRIHLQTEKCMQNASWVDRRACPAEKNIYTHAKLGRMKELGGNGGVNRTGPALGGWGNWSRGLIPTSGQLSESEEKHLRLRVKQLICSSLNGMSSHQTVLGAAKHTPDKDADPLEGLAAGSWRLGIVEQSQGEGCFWLWRDGLRGCERR